LGEAYTIFDDKGFVFTYGDYDMSNDSIMIIWNLLLADGWDQIAVPSSSGYGYKAQGLYLNDILLDINGSFQVVQNDTMAHVTLRQYLPREELSDASLNMSDLPLTWTLTYPTLAYIDSIRISDMETLISMSQIDGLDFFTEDIKQELYNYLDEDIKNIIE
jgi:hypothetical protein